MDKKRTNSSGDDDDAMKRRDETELIRPYRPPVTFSRSIFLTQETDKLPECTMEREKKLNALHGSSGFEELPRRRD